MKPKRLLVVVIATLAGAGALGAAVRFAVGWQDPTFRRPIEGWYQAKKWRLRAPGMARERFEAGQPTVFGAGPSETALVGLQGEEALKDLGFECALTFVEPRNEAQREVLSYRGLNTTSKPSWLAPGWDEITCTWRDGSVRQFAVQHAAAGCMGEMFPGAAAFNVKTLRLLIAKANG